MAESREELLVEKVRSIMVDLSGSELPAAARATTFVELGFDSLFLTQLRTRLNRELKVKLRLRQLSEEFCSIEALAKHLDGAVPPEVLAPPRDAHVEASARLSDATDATNGTNGGGANEITADGVVRGGTASEVGANGGVVNGFIANGIGANGAVMNGVIADGAGVNGAAVNGLAADRTTAGVATSGTPTDLSPATATPTQNASRSSTLERVFAQQLQIMAQQLTMLGARPGGTGAQPQAPLSDGAAQLSNAAALPKVAHGATPPAPATTPPTMSEEATSSAALPRAPKPFGAQARIERKDGSELSPRQQRHLAQLIARYSERTRGSKDYTQQHRPHLADPRAVSGFHPKTKEMTYPIVAQRSAGSRIWDVDGNEYIDMLNGYGSCFFGHAAPFVVEALQKQLRDGFEIGPQNHLAGKVAEQFCRLVGHERAAFCNTGSEAVLGAIRMARTITGKSKVVMFHGAYHGINDEVIVRGSQTGKGLPAAAGIPAQHTANILMFDYGDPAALSAIEAHADDIAAVIVEPVQSRKPELQPRDFLHALRALTERSEMALIMDEVVCGFRVAPGGAQEYFGIQADIAAYGKVVGGGLPIGVIAGKRAYMDALDGGSWQFGDDSVPEVGVTYFAGTFVRHPLALAAAQASLSYLEREGPSLQRTLNARANTLADGMNAFAREAGVPVWFGQFSTIMKPHWQQEQALPDLLFAHMRLRGVHIYDGRPCFLTTCHGEAEVAQVLEAFRESIYELQGGGFFVHPERDKPAISAEPPLPGARLGRDQEGNPAWFMPDPARPGKYQLIAAS